MISDDAAVYANFTASQKCWAHLLRKAIKLTLQDPNNTEYRGLDGPAVGDLPRSLSRPARQAAQRRRAGHGKSASSTSEIIELCEANVARGPAANGRARERLSPAGR